MEPNQLAHYITVTDHSVTGETFELYRDAALDLLVTSPKPAAADLGRYYESVDYISHTDGARSIVEKAYQVVKKIALKRKVALINSFKSSGKLLLDIGAGTGDFVLAASKKGWDATGVEPNSNAKSIGIAKGVSYADSSDLLADNSFDIITMWHVLEHVPDVAAQIAELKRLLKPDGFIIIAVPNFRSYDALYYGRYWAAYDVPRHLSHFSKTAIDGLFTKQGFKVTRILPMVFDAFYVSLLSEKYKTGKMQYAKAIWIGLRSNLKAKSKMEYSSHIYVIRNT